MSNAGISHFFNYFNGFDETAPVGSGTERDSYIAGGNLRSNAIDGRTEPPVPGL